VVDHNNQLRLNLGYFTNLQPGDSRVIPFDIPYIHLSPDLDLTDINGNAQFTRTANGVLATIRIKANVQAECVRCLREFTLPLEVDFKELYASKRDSVSDSGLLFPEDGRIDLSPLLREYMLLEKPINSICSAECKGLCPVCGENLNEVECHHNETTIDPRMEILKKLLD